MEGTFDNQENQAQSMANEAEQFATEISYGVKYVKVSDKLEKSNTVAHINITTLENENWCIELNTQGFLIVSNELDTIDNSTKLNNILNKTNLFETIESLMFNISPLFCKKFNQMVSDKLSKIN
ncbi:GSK3-beta interaction [Brachionus plicatilis]|uniref:GSK3-beta interaction n=1 Tax=Brachionus plicatilis TaxID=10195 RepID=A0A3M7SLC9_BRAPC|nr:GSK3-beta interaction [Brachionus plicatilis]